MVRQAIIVMFAVCLSAIFASTADADVEISAKPTSNMTCSGGVCSPTAKQAVLNVSDLAAMLSTGDVKVTSGSLAKDINFDASLRWASPQRLTLDSYRSIAFNKPLVVTGAGALTITTNDGTGGGDFRFFKNGHVEFWDTESNLVINAQEFFLVNSLRGLSKAAEKNGHSLALARSIDAVHKSYTEALVRVGWGGVLEGLGNTISNLTINDSTTGHDVGLFSQIGAAGVGSTVIRDIGLLSVNINATGNQQHVGAFAGSNESGSIIRNSYATGQIITSGAGSSAGGLLGQSFDGAILTSRSAVNIAGSDGTAAEGGLVGDNEEECCNQMIFASYATGTTTGGAGTAVGGLIGINASGQIQDSYASGSVETGIGGFGGGLIGVNTNAAGSGPSVTFTSYSTGSVSGGSGATLGGLIGSDAANSNNKKLYWDTDTSGVSDPARGAGNIENDPNIVALSDSQLKSGLPSGFHKKYWAENPAINSGYPYARANPPPE